MEGDEAAWLRPFKVVDRSAESSTITSLRLESVEPDTETPVEAMEAAPEPADVDPPMAAPGPVVTFKRSGRQAVWTLHSRSLLEFAEDQGLEPPFSCRAGVCGTCSTRLLSGQVVYSEEPLDEPDAGRVLVCCAKPVSAVTLDL
jgi:uncharacterized protein